MPDHTSRDVLLGIAGAISTLAIVSAYFALTGYRVTPVLDYSPHSLASAHYSLTLATLGAALLVAWRHNLRVASVLAAGSLLVSGGLLAGPLAGPASSYPPSVFRLNIELTVFTVLFLLLASAEYAIRNPDTISAVFTPRARRTALWTGTLHLLLALTLHAAIDPGGAYFFNLFNSLLTVWMAVGAFIVGAVAGLLTARYGLLAPTAIALGAFTAAASQTWEYVQSLSRPGADLASAAAFTALDMYLVGWFVLLGLLLLVSALEYLFRTRIVRSPTGTS